MLTAALLGIVQGMTEFLPVSSSAHLILARLFFGWEAPEFGLAFDVALHMGTLAAICAYFHSDILGMIRALPALLSPNPSASGRLMRLIAVGTIPAVIVGLLFNDYIENTLRAPVVAATMLAVGAVLMLVAERSGPWSRDEGTLSFSDAAIIGIAQASALMPGVSRSGTTIAVAMLLGIRRDSAARFTFLLAIPAIVAAGGKEAIALRTMQPDASLLTLFAVGALVSGVVGYVTIRYFLRFLAFNSLNVFAYYRMALAALTFVWLFAA